MRNVIKIFTCFFLITLASLTASAQQLTLEPYKDELFNYSLTLETGDGGAFEYKDYDEMRDVNGRDEIPVKKALPQYVDQDIIGSERDLVLKERGVRVEYLEAGSEKDADFAVVFAHGAHGTKALGMQDWTFGGNFNRLKHFAIYGNGTYISPSFTDFESTGAAQIALLVKHAREVSPKAKIILACASSGGGICEGAFFQPETLKEISAFILMSTGTAPKMFKSKALADYRGPLFLLHGENDKLVNAKNHYQAFSQFKKSHPDYPVRFQLFKTGGHGTPIRMIDWREALNWIFSF